MRLVPRHWHTETWVCSMRGHLAPAAGVCHLGPEDRRLGVELGDGHRLARCLRCDMWVEVADPVAGSVTSERLPPIAELPKPRRGKVLQEAVLLRVIAIERAVHCVGFGLLALALAALELKLPGLQTTARSLNRQLSSNGVQAGQAASRDHLNRWLHRLIGLHKSAVTVLLVTALVYCVVEGVEAVGLWRERRWAEYLTALATVGFLPFEAHELIERVTVFRIGALVANLAILAWLVWTKHLFGVRGGSSTLHEDVDWDAILADPTPARLH
ncbi:MAG TPA: DUF2127 domain-containing protein [Acidimicrobiales bacterium]